MQTLIILFLIITTYLLVKQHTCATPKKKKLKHYLLLICTGWIMLLTLYLFFCSPSLVNATETRLEFLFFILFVLYNVFFLAYIRRLFNNSYAYLLLLFPITYLFYLKTY